MQLVPCAHGNTEPMFLKTELSTNHNENEPRLVSFVFVFTWETVAQRANNKAGIFFSSTFKKVVCLREFFTRHAKLLGSIPALTETTGPWPYQKPLVFIQNLIQTPTFF